MLGSLLKATVKTALLPVVVAKDVLIALPDSAEGDTPFSDAGKVIGSIADDLDDIL